MDYIYLWLWIGVFGEFICFIEDSDADDVSFITLGDVVIVVGGPISLFFIIRHHINKIKIDLDFD